LDVSPIPVGNGINILRYVSIEIAVGIPRKPGKRERKKNKYTLKIQTKNHTLKTIYIQTYLWTTMNAVLNACRMLAECLPNAVLNACRLLWMSIGRGLKERINLFCKKQWLEIQTEIISVNTIP
jgi:hypothetical protein